VAKPRSIRFPDALVARIDLVDGGSFHSKVLDLVEEGLHTYGRDRGGPADPMPERRTPPAATVSVPGGKRTYAPDAKPK
jgi:hypothetical protein